MTEKCSEFIWVQRDGTPIHVRQMTDKHLLCTIRMLRRQSKAWAEKENREACRGCYDADDFRGTYFMEDDLLAENHPTWGSLQFERRIRGLEELQLED